MVGWIRKHWQLIGLIFTTVLAIVAIAQNVISDYQNRPVRRLHIAESALPIYLPYPNLSGIEVYETATRLPVTGDVGRLDLQVWNSGTESISGTSIVTPLAFRLSQGSRLLSVEITNARTVEDNFSVQTVGDNQIQITWDEFEPGYAIVVTAVVLGTPAVANISHDLNQVAVLRYEPQSQRFFLGSFWASLVASILVLTLSIPLGWVYRRIFDNADREGDVQIQKKEELLEVVEAEPDAQEDVRRLKKDIERLETIRWVYSNTRIITSATFFFIAPAAGLLLLIMTVYELNFVEVIEIPLRMAFAAA